MTLHTLLVFALDHHASERLSSRIAKQEPAVLTQRSINLARFLLHEGNVFKRNFLANTNVDKNLRIPGKVLRELRKRLPFVHHHPQKTDRGDHPITGKTNFRENNVA